MALGVDPATIVVPDGEPWSGAAMAAMEVGAGTAIATIVAIADGTVSMYVSTGGGVIGSIAERDLGVGLFAERDA